VSWPIVRSARRTLAPALPVLGTLSDFRLQDQSGRDYGSSELRGKIWVAGAISTACNACSELTAAMGRIQHRARNLGASFHLISLGVDPARDTAAALAEHGKRHRASPRMWSFLTGDRAVIEAVVAAGRLEGHHGRLALIDPRMQIRGYYFAHQRDEIDRLLRDAGLVAARR